MASQRWISPDSLSTHSRGLDTSRTGSVLLPGESTLAQNLGLLVCAKNRKLLPNWMKSAVQRGDSWREMRWVNKERPSPPGGGVNCRWQVPSPLVPEKDRRTGEGPRTTLPPPPSHKVASCRIGGWWLVQEVKGTSRRTSRRSRWRSRLIIVGKSCCWGGILPHPHFHLAGLGLPLTGWQWEEKCAQPLIVSQAAAPVQGGQGQGASHYLLLLISCFPSQCCCCSLSCQHGLLRNSSQLYKQLHT